MIVARVVMCPIPLRHGIRRDVTVERSKLTQHAEGGERVGPCAPYSKRGTPTHGECGFVCHVQRQSEQVYCPAGRRVSW